MSERYLSFPFRITPEGAVAVVDADAHIRQRIEQVLFTSPGERVMLPEFGCGARDLVFAANDEVLAAATEFTVARALQLHLGDQVMVNRVDVVAEGEKLRIEVVYTKTRDLEQQRVAFRLATGEVGGGA